MKKRKQLGWAKECLKFRDGRGEAYATPALSTYWNVTLGRDVVRVYVRKRDAGADRLPCRALPVYVEFPEEEEK